MGKGAEERSTVLSPCVSKSTIGILGLSGKGPKGGSGGLGWVPSSEIYGQIGRGWPGAWARR
jgi:hypothetical protein